MLTQYDAMILAGLPTREVVAGSGPRFGVVKPALAEDRAAVEAERPARLDILVEPIVRVVVSVRAYLGTRGRREGRVFSEASQVTLPD